MKKYIKTKILPYVIYYIYKIYFSTIRYIEPSLPKELTKNKNNNFIVAHFHQDELALIPTRANSNFHVMTSQSTDGRMMKKFLNLMGYSCVEGSSSRGGAKALLQLIEVLKEKNASAVMAVDGPKGPIYKVKEGIIMLSKHTGLPILPVTVEVKDPFIFTKSWNKAILPKPFSKIIIKFSEPLFVDKNVSKDDIKDLALTLESRLKNIKGL
jgi:lysophospholipid acyltransferase (LPLAT)-like uncharacterized protein